MPMYFVSGKILLQHIKELPSCKTNAVHCLHVLYILYLYTTRVVWQTKCKLVMCITHVLPVFIAGHAYIKIVCSSACTYQAFKFYMQ